MIKQIQSIHSIKSSKSTSTKNKKLFLTNVKCPKCDKQLVTSDLEDYPFLCKDCDENFYNMEVDKPKNKFIIYIPMFEEKFLDNLGNMKIQNIIEKYQAKSFAYDPQTNKLEIAFDEMLETNEMTNISKDLNNLDFSK